MQRKLHSQLLLALCTLALLLSNARPANATVPKPPGLDTCKPGSPLAQTFARAMSRFGSLSGCFVSKDTTALRGTSGAISEPKEYGYAIQLNTVNSTPYTSMVIDAMFSRVSAQWKNVEPLWQKDKAHYEARLAKLVQSILPKDMPHPSMSIDQPVLVSIRRLDPNAYAVVSIRQRILTIKGNHFTSIKAEGAAVVLHDGNLIRLSLARGLDNKADVTNVISGISSWVHELEESP